ncbi:ABC transporter permease [Actinomyces succiniciruminis]|uniref:Efflux ABC transporter, permease protein n=1 Tax=Actinomyces succiniciruminis TaxID=1522002 RepID=A0A1L7RC41_9ACTO|nr:FtsX-like permease family protein [Actinomyces succiniciruminis]CED91485.1 Efflux ABC transporter, permease protein [Actinomyces succiniciruminis]
MSTRSGIGRPMTNRRMFATMLIGAMLRRRSRALSAIGSSVVGAATLFCLASICLAVPAQMSAEMRQYGANLIVTPIDAEAASTTNDSATTVATDAAAATANADGAGESPTSTARISAADLALVDAAVAAATDTTTEQLATAAYRYETIRINRSPYLLAGIDVDAVRALNGHWEIDGDWPQAGQVLIGLNVAENAGLKLGSTVNAEYLSSDNLASVGEGDGDAGASASSSATAATGDPAKSDETAAGQAQWRVSGIVDTGGEEDDIVYVPTAALESLTGTIDAGYDVVEFSVDTSAATVDEAAAAVADSDAAGRVAAQPVSKISSGDTRIITMLNTLFWVVAVVVLGLTLVGVSTTMTVVVAERRNEIGLRKALGASGGSIATEFFAEAALLGLIGGLVGTAIGYGLAVAVGLGVFDRPIGFSWWLAAASVALTTLVAVVASYSPVRRASRIDPALVLREE